MRALVVGGSASGKSSFAEKLAVSLGEPRYYIATMAVFGEEAKKRIERHRQMRRGKGFETIECERSLGSVTLPARGVVLLEDMGNICANELFSGFDKHNTVDIILNDIQKLSRQCEHLIIVTNEVFSGGTDYEGDTLLYMQKLAKINNTLASEFDRVYHIQCGIEVRIK